MMFNRTNLYYAGMILLNVTVYAFKPNVASILGGGVFIFLLLADTFKRRVQ